VLEANHSLALKAKVVQDVQKYQEIEEEEQMASTSDMDVDIAFLAKKWRKSFGKKGLSFPSEKKRTC
jgi:hypothetical protein